MFFHFVNRLREWEISKLYKQSAMASSPAHKAATSWTGWPRFDYPQDASSDGKAGATWSSRKKGSGLSKGAKSNSTRDNGSSEMVPRSRSRRELLKRQLVCQRRGKPPDMCLGTLGRLHATQAVSWLRERSWVVLSTRVTIMLGTVPTGDAMYSWTQQRCSRQGCLTAHTVHRMR